ncbi:hypothetical protein AA637_11250 [Cyanobacterium sp. HL-69]|nr:hypothetical protein AA637_11250 [Cyanobacterium sp. HL-69]
MPTLKVYIGKRVRQGARDWGLSSLLKKLNPFIKL